MNQTTEDVIQFLNFPEFDFGTTPLDAELLQDPDLLRDRVVSLLDATGRAADSRPEADALRGRLADVEWAVVAQEMQERVKMASGFFDPVAEETARANG